MNGSPKNPLCFGWRQESCKFIHIDQVQAWSDREAHLLYAMRIIHDVWNEMEVSTVAHCWAKSAILTPMTNAYILAEHASRTKCTTSQETKYLVNSIVDIFIKVLLLTNSPSLDSLTENIFGLASLQQCSRAELAVKLEEWSVIEESGDFVVFLNKEQEGCLCEEHL